MLTYEQFVEEAVALMDEGMTDIDIIMMLVDQVIEGKLNRYDKNNLEFFTNFSHVPSVSRRLGISEYVPENACKAGEGLIYAL